MTLLSIICTVFIIFCCIIIFIFYLHSTKRERELRKKYKHKNAILYKYVALDLNEYILEGYEAYGKHVFLNVNAINKLTYDVDSDDEDADVKTYYNLHLHGNFGEYVFTFGHQKDRDKLSTAINTIWKKSGKIQ